MKPLDLEISYAGHYSVQIWREGDVAVYARSLTPKHQPHELELVFIKSVPDTTWPDGRVTPAHEAFPGPSEWGRMGFSFPIRCKDPVLALAKDVSGISKDRAGFVKERRREIQWPK